MDKWSVDTIREADCDIEEIADWYEDITKSAKSANSFIDTAQSTLHSLETWPNTHPSLSLRAHVVGVAIQ